MKNQIIYILIFLMSGVLSSCYEDLGNYDYIDVEEPVITNIQDSVFTAFVGDSLHIRPEISHSLAETDNFSFTWKIDIPAELRSAEYEGRELNIVFGFEPGPYNGRLTVTDHSNEMKYFYYFKINAITEFSIGTVVLSDDQGQGRLSFIKPDSTIVNNLYENLHDEMLPTSPFRLLAVNESWQPTNIKSFWILGKEGEKPGVILDASSMFRTQYVNDNFFIEPPAINLGNLYTQMNGAVSGIINDKIYLGTTSTAPFAPDYGKFGNASSGDYKLAPSFIFNEFPTYYLGYNELNHDFVWFNAQGAYFGTNYDVDSVGTGFDPMNPGIEFSHMLYVSGGSSYAYGVDSEGVFSELKFIFNPGPPATFITFYIREFIRPDLINDTNIWIGNPQGIIYFTSNDKIYRYNPLNEEVVALAADFGGEKVTMIEFVPNSDLLAAGTNGALHYLDIGVGKNGNILHTIDGISGAPVDIYIRQ